MSDFFESEETGKLFIEKVLFAAGYPVLFTCRNASEELYLCVCCQANAEGKKWLLAETEPDIIVQMLSDKITIRDAFLKAGKKRFSIIQTCSSVRLEADSPEDWNEERSLSLPDKGAYMEAEEDEFDEEIAFYLKKKDDILYDTSVEVSVQGNLKVKSVMVTTYDLKFSMNRKTDKNEENYSDTFYRITAREELKVPETFCRDDNWRILAA